jgi:hypothetical protein
MDTKKISPVATDSETPLDHPLQEEQKEEAGKSILIKSLFWFILLPGTGMLLLKWLLQL